MTVPRYGGVLVSAKTKPDMSLIHPTDPTQLRKELSGAEWPTNA
jgi:hypothetical protein